MSLDFEDADGAHGEEELEHSNAQRVSWNDRGNLGGTSQDAKHDDPSLLSSSEGTVAQHWRQSPFAVGRTKATWADEQAGCRRFHSQNSAQSHLPNAFRFICTGFLCQRAGRVGNMIVLYTRTEEFTLDNGERATQQRLVCVLGPYWTVLVGVTLPLLIFLSTWTALTRLPEHGLSVIVTWSLATGGLFVSLLNVACRDPGILRRHSEPPSGEENEWRWNDQAFTYRPTHARYDPECAVVVEHFDHTCPWTGTAVGKKNMCWFRCFLCFVLVSIIYNVSLLTLI